MLPDFSQTSYKHTSGQLEPKQPEILTKENMDELNRWKNSKKSIKEASHFKEAIDEALKSHCPSIDK